MFKRRIDKSPAKGATPVVSKQSAIVSLPKINYTWFALLLIIGLLLSSLSFLYERWPVNSIEIRGSFSIWPENKIAEELAWLKEESFFSVDLQRVYAVADALPLLNILTVKKQWPGTVLLNVYEEVPMAVWNEKKLLTLGGLLVNKPYFYDVKELANIRGSSHYAEVATRHYRRLSQALIPDGIAIKTLNISSVGSIKVWLSNGWVIDFGRQYFEERVQRLVSLMNVLSGQQIATLDLRYGKGVAISWKHQESDS